MALPLKQRQRAEREIVRAAIESAQNYGFTLWHVNNGEDETPVTNTDAAMEEAFACDEAKIYFWADATETKYAWIYIVLGNDGWDVISDYTVDLEDAISDESVETLVRHWEGESQ